METPLPHIVVENSPEKDAKEIWNNGEIGVLLRREEGKSIRLRLPKYDEKKLSHVRLSDQWEIEEWLRNGPRNRIPLWNETRKFWELPKSRFNGLVTMFLKRFGRVYIIQPYREKEICSPSCRAALGHECQCSCMGLHHGAGNDARWFDVSEAFSILLGGRRVACRLLIEKEQAPLK